MFSVCVVGHLTRDIVSLGGQETEKPGGTARYTALALKRLGANVSVVTKLAAADEDELLLDFVEEDIPVHVGPSSSTTTFVHLYSEDANTRQEQVRDVASPFTVDDVVGIDADVFHLGPLNRNDIPLDVVEHLSARATVSIDVQGYLREVVSEIGGWRTLRYGPWAGIDSILASTHILKASAEEARIMSENEEDLTAALAARGPSEVIITRGSESSILYCEGPGGHGGHCIPSYQPETAIVDPTGCGDTFMAGYLHWRTRSSDAAKIGQFAAMTATLKLAGDGAFNGGEADVLEFARKAGRPL